VELLLVAGPGRDAVVSTAAARRLTSVHLHALDCELGPRETFTARPPGVAGDRLAHLDERGVAQPGTTVEPGDILVARKGPRFLVALSPEEQRLAGAEEGAETSRDTSLRCPANVRGVVTEVKVREKQASVVVRREQALAVGDVLRAGSGAIAVVGAIADGLAGGDLAWPSLGGLHRVQKLATADDTLEARSIGPYSLVTQQPLGAKAHFGGQRLGKRSLQALLDRGAAVAVHELLTVKSDDVAGRFRLYESIVTGQPTCHATVPASTQLAEAELRALGFGVDLAEDRPRLRLDLRQRFCRG
jgi:DNA-directed RNA polymerase beta subunit